MINILLISHSKNLSEEAYKYITHMAPKNKNVRLDFLGGDGKGGFGNDLSKIEETLSYLVDTKNKTLIFCDMGSSIMIAKSIIEEKGWSSESLKIMNASFIEGSFIAYASYSRNNLKDVILEAEAKIEKIIN